MFKKIFGLLIVMSLTLAGYVPFTAQDNLSAGVSAALAASSGSLDVLIQTADQNYSTIVAVVEDLGGNVTHTFKYANGLAATLPKTAVATLAGVAGVQQISLDTMRYIIPTSGEETAPSARPAGGMSQEQANDLDRSISSGEAFYLDAELEAMTLDPAEIAADPETYYNFVSMNAGPIWSTGNFGQNSLAVVIDTGIYDQHFMLAGSVVGGVDMSPDVGTPFEGFNLASNHWHGTHVSGILAGHGAIVLANNHLLVRSIELHSGSPLPPFSASNKLIPLLGMAPGAQLYGIKVFPHTGAGVPSSRIIAAIEHAIDLHVNGVYDVDVINMSLGGATIFDGRDLEDQIVDFATSVGIAVVSAAGNDGPTSLTTSSPGSANSSITVGAVAHPVNTRVFWDFSFGALGIGEFLFVDDNPQMIYFSSRGPTSDGRDKPTASAVGVFVFSAFNSTASPQGLAFASGTSMATPGIAGITALLNTFGETVGASPFDYKEAIVNGSTLLPGYGEFEQGAGFVDAAAAYTALQNDGSLGSAHPDVRNGYSRQSVKPEGMQIQNVNSKKGFTYPVQDLEPGKAHHFYFDLHPNAERITLDITGVDLGDLDLGLNSFEVYVQSASRTYLNPYIDSTNVFGDASFVIEDMNTTASGDFFGAFLTNLPLMPGYIRVVIENDFTSADNLSATVNIRVHTVDNSAKADETYNGSVNTGESVGFFPVGFGPNGVEFTLSWMRDWESYPTSDLDLIVAWFDTDGELHFEFGAATLNSPERLILDSTNIASVFVLVDGFETNGLDEPWELLVTYR
jgi:hypothetical protein